MSLVSETCQVPDLRRLYRELGLPRAGTFVEIGGFDGESWSNTSFLADEGWRGLYVEPVPAFGRLIRARHLLNKVELAQVAIAPKPGTLEISAMGPLTTMVEANKVAYGKIDWAQDLASQAKAMLVRTDTLSAVLHRHRVPPRFDLLVVDVEGAEEVIIDALLASPWRPRVVVAELEDRHDSFTAFTEIADSHRRARAALVSAGYSEHYSDAINTVFQLRDGAAAAHSGSALAASR